MKRKSNEGFACPARMSSYRDFMVSYHKVILCVSLLSHRLCAARIRHTAVLKGVYVMSNTQNVFPHLPKNKPQCGPNFLPGLEPTGRTRRVRLVFCESLFLILITHCLNLSMGVCVHAALISVCFQYQKVNNPPQRQLLTVAQKKTLKSPQ